MVDSNLADWYATLPPEWKHRTIGIVNEIPAVEDLAVTEKWPGEQHVYNDVPLASIVNDYRVCRIFCRRVIMACIKWLGIGGHVDDAGEYDQSVYVIQQMVDDVSACVPFHLDYELQVVAKEMGQEQNGKISQCGRCTAAKDVADLFSIAAEAFGGYSLVWPLYVAANAETVPQAQRDWLFGRLSVIGTKFGLSSAQVLVLARRHILTCGPMFP
ncbi:hypothetical protein DE146DRAFT_355768 [Phaeosphaeria sp. MPI-PUGE-AT-0046c]|nr:hypothetical protein DE146DRAFT_355768 [Phaeosphaeria sp. MPI-PUGE-AT-0046c]